MVTDNDEMPSVGQVAKWVLIGLVVLFVIGTIFTFANGGVNLAYQKVFGVPFENVRRHNYEHTKSYEKGSADRLSALCGQVDAAGADHKQMLREQIKQEFSDMNSSDAPDYLRACLSAARSN
jgi:hypothetical protein